MRGEGAGPPFPTFCTIRESVGLSVVSDSLLSQDYSSPGSSVYSLNNKINYISLPTIRKLLKDEKLSNKKLNKVQLIMRNCRR